MLLIILSLFVGGVLAGLIQFFVDYKKLPIYDPAGGAAESMDGEGKPSFWKRLLKFLNDHWQFFGYIIIGISGAMLAPLINELMPASLNGLKNIKTPPAVLNAEYYWSLLVLLGYGIVFGYSAVRLLRSLGTLMVDSVSKAQQAQDETIKKLKQQVEELKTALPAGNNASAPEEVKEERAAPNHGDDEAALAELAELEGLENSACVETPRPWSDWRVAESLALLRKTVNTLAPGRDKLSDGSVGDLKHQKTSSDHNPWVRDGSSSRGVVTAIDITHDPAKGCDCNRIAKSLEAAKDRRIKYVIWNSRIMNSASINGAGAWTWRPYSGKNPHNKHIHISVKCDKGSYDATDAWVVAVK